MKKITIAALVLVLALSLSLFGCGTSDAEEPSDAPEISETVEEPATEPIEKTIPAIAEALGLSDQGEVYFEIIGARDGAEFNGGAVELYIFDEDQEEYKTLVAGDGFVVPAAYKDGVVLVFPEGTDPDPELVQAFDDLTF